MFPATILLAFVLTLPRPGGPTTPAPGYISGRVVDSRGRPVEATVALNRWGGGPGTPAGTARYGTFCALAGSIHIRIPRNTIAVMGCILTSPTFTTGAEC